MQKKMYAVVSGCTEYVGIESTHYTKKAACEDMKQRICSMALEIAENEKDLDQVEYEIGEDSGYVFNGDDTTYAYNVVEVPDPEE